MKKSDMHKHVGFFFSYVLSHCAFGARSRLFWCSFFLVRERTNQESGPKAAAFGNCSSRRSNNERRCFCFCKIPPSAGHSSHPADGLARARIFAAPFCLKFVQTRARCRWQKFLLSLVACYLCVGVFSSKRQRKS